jgi:adsorption protein B
MDRALTLLLMVNAGLLAWRVFMRAWFTTMAYGIAEGLRSVPRLLIGNLIAMLAAARAVSLHLGGGAKRWEKTMHIFPRELPQ